MSVGRQLLWLLFRYAVGGMVIFGTPFSLFGPHPWWTFAGRAALFAVWWHLHQRMTEGGVQVACRPSSTTGALR